MNAFRKLSSHSARFARPLQANAPAPIRNLSTVSETAVAEKMAVLEANMQRKAKECATHAQALTAPKATNIWLSDPGTYPIFFIIGGACIFCGVYYIHNLATNPDIRIAKSKRKYATIRTWGQTEWGHH